MIVDDYMTMGLRNIVPYGTDYHVVKLPFKLDYTHFDKHAKEMLPMRQDGSLDGAHAFLPYKVLIFVGCRRSPQEYIVLAIRRQRKDDTQHELWELALLHNLWGHIIGISTQAAIMIDGSVQIYVATEERIHEISVMLTTLVSGDDIGEQWKEMLAKRQIVLSWEPASEDALSGTVKFQWDMLRHVVVGTRLMNCKNIIEHQYVPDRKLQAARARKQLHPLVTWHELILDNEKKTRRHQSLQAPLGDHNAVHWVRGHFKTYTEEHKLFGKHTGEYWWQEHLAGQDSHRFAGKDYVIA